MHKPYALHVTTHFERDLKRLKKMDREVGQEIEALGQILQKDPYNVNRSYNIRKLAGVVKGEGQWRIC